MTSDSEAEYKYSSSNYVHVKAAYVSQCPVGELRCVNGHCITVSQLCDKVIVIIECANKKLRTFVHQPNTHISNTQWNTFFFCSLSDYWLPGWSWWGNVHLLRGKTENKNFIHFIFIASVHLKWSASIQIAKSLFLRVKQNMCR